MPLGYAALVSLIDTNIISGNRATLASNLREVLYELADTADAGGTASSYVGLTGDETIEGIKTFDSIPVLPSTSPTLDNHAARKKYVDDQITAAQVGLWDDRGSFDASGNVFPSSGGSGTAGAILKGDIWTISVVGTLGGSVVSIGDTVRALTDTPGQTAANWSILETNIGYVPVNKAGDTMGGALNMGTYAITNADSVDVTAGYKIGGDLIFTYHNANGNLRIGATNYSVTNGTDNTIIGDDAAYSAVSITTVTAVGKNSLVNITSTSDIAAFGSNSGRNSTSAAYCMYFGPDCGYYNETGNYQICIGRLASVPSGSPDIDAITIIANGGTARATNQFVAGSIDAPMYHIFFGRGQGSIAAKPSNYDPVYLYPQGDIEDGDTDDVDVSGCVFTFRNYRSVGDGNAGNILFQYSPKIGTGDTLQTWVDALTMNGNTGIFNFNVGASFNNASAPSSISNGFQIYATDIAPGESSIHIKNENGDVVKLYKYINADFGNTVNTGDSDTDDLIDALVAAGIAHGLIATS
jgi:hypothetical protein